MRAFSGVILTGGAKRTTIGDQGIFLIGSIANIRVADKDSLRAGS